MSSVGEITKEGTIGLVVKKRFENADERDLNARATVEIIDLDGPIAIRGTYEPGWRHSESEAARNGGPSCGEEHFGYVVTGAMTIRMDDGTEIELSAGDVASIPPGHDAWVTGSTPCVFLDFQHQPNRMSRSAETEEKDTVILNK